MHVPSTHVITCQGNSLERLRLAIPRRRQHTRGIRGRRPSYSQVCLFAILCQSKDLRVAEITMRFNKAWLAESQPQEGNMNQARKIACIVHNSEQTEVLLNCTHECFQSMRKGPSPPPVAATPPATPPSQPRAPARRLCRDLAPLFRFQIVSRVWH